MNINIAVFNHASMWNVCHTAFNARCPHPRYNLRYAVTHVNTFTSCVLIISIGEY